MSILRLRRINGGNRWQRTYRRFDGAYVVISDVTQQGATKPHFEVEVTTPRVDRPWRSSTSIHYRSTRRAARKAAKTVRVS